MMYFLATAINTSPLPHVTASASTIAKILGLVFAVIGGLALLMVTIGGLRFITSTGDPQKVQQAKNTIFYALIGLVVAIFAETIVAFVVNKVG